MPARTHQIPGGAKVMMFTCDDCGAPASFSIGANLREALSTGDVTKAGRWFCGWANGQPTCIGKGRAAPADLLGHAA